MRKIHFHTFFLTFLTLCLPQVALAEYDKPYVGDIIEYETRYEDTFVHIARDYNLGFTELRAANPYVDPWLPGRGTDLILPTRHILPNAPHEGVVINLADMRLYAFVNGDKAPFHTPIGVGREGLNTPEGSTSIVRKKEGPTWTPTDRMRRDDPTLKPYYPPGVDNPLGTHALYLGWPTYAIHGTNRPFGIGRRISSGCIRLYPEAIIKLFDQIPIGTKVTVVNQPIKVAWIDDELYLEANPSLEQSRAMEEMGEVPEEKISNDEMNMIIKTAGEFKDRLRWPAIRKALKERNGYPVAIARRPSLEVKNNEIIEHETGAEVSEEAFEPPEEIKDMIEGAEEKETANSDKADAGEKTLDEIYVAEDEARPLAYDNPANPFKTLNP